MDIKNYRYPIVFHVLSGVFMSLLVFTGIVTMGNAIVRLNRADVNVGIEICEVVGPSDCITTTNGYIIVTANRYTVEKNKLLNEQVVIRTSNHTCDAMYDLSILHKLICGQNSDLEVTDVVLDYELSRKGVVYHCDITMIHLSIYILLASGVITYGLIHANKMDKLITNNFPSLTQA